MKNVALRQKYPPERMAAIRRMYDEDVQAWAPILKEMQLDIKCVSTEQGPWPDDEWNRRTKGENKRPCEHEDVLTQYVDKVVNKIEMNPMGVECQPMGPGASKESAEFTENRIRQWEYESKASQAYASAVLNAARSSFGCWILETGYSKDFNQRVYIEEIDDPTTITPGFFKKKDGSDMRRAWRGEQMSHEEFFQRFGKRSSFKSFVGNEVPGWIDKTTAYVVVWWHLEEDDRELMEIYGPEGRFTAYRDEYPDEADDFGGEVKNTRTEKRRRVLKTLINGLEVLDETEWIDPGDGDECPPEIPVLITTGRVKYENGQKYIDSLIRKGRSGQLRYDYLISATQETIAMTPKVKVMGPEGAFDSTTPWPQIHKNPIAYAEYVSKEDAAGRALPPPQWITYEPPIAALEIEKQSILIGIQNAIGMSSTERKDRAAKSGKALDKLTEEMEVGTAHYFGSQARAQERQYRILERILPALERDRQQIGIRDKFGKHQTVDVKPEYYDASHSVAVGVGKLYQTQQEKQEETADTLMQTKDPQILLAVLPGAIRMKIPGEWGDQIADMIEAIQPPQMQQARQAQQNKIPPQVMQAQQQAHQAIQALNAHAKALEQKIIELEDEKRGKVVERTFDQRIHEDDNRVKLEIAQINASTKERMDALNAQVEYIRNTTDALMSHLGMQSSEAQAQADREHASQEGQMDREHAAMQSDADRQAAAEQAAQAAQVTE